MLNFDEIEEVFDCDEVNEVVNSEGLEDWIKSEGTEVTEVIPSSRRRKRSS